MWQDKRSQELEILDHGPSAYTLQEYNQCLKYLCRINHLLGGFYASKRAFAQLKDPFHSVLEIGCGGGYFCHMLHRWFPHAKIVGVDLSEEAISHSLQNLSKAEEKFVSFEIQKNKTIKTQTTLESSMRNKKIEINFKDFTDVYITLFDNLKSRKNRFD